MSKKNKAMSFTHVPQKAAPRFPIPVPDINNMDDVGYFPDEVLHDKISRLESERTRLLELRLEPIPWEVELAYLRREQQIRKTRSERHDQYVKELSAQGDDGYYGSHYDATPATVNVSTRILN